LPSTTTMRTGSASSSDAPVRRAGPCAGSYPSKPEVTSEKREEQGWTANKQGAANTPR
jgi:hypothetical protein